MMHLIVCRSLVQQLTDSPQDLAIVTALIELGKGFNLRIVAEGVETQEQVEETTLPKESFLFSCINFLYRFWFWGIIKHILSQSKLRS